MQVARVQAEGGCEGGDVEEKNAKNAKKRKKNMTANNTDKELSIQINLGGFSFSINTPHLKAKESVDTYDFDSKLKNFYHLNTITEWSMPQVMIVPFDLFDHSATESYLQSAKMIDKTKQKAMFAVNGEIVALWAVDKKLYESINAKIINLQHTHSLLKLINKQTPKNNATAIYIDTAKLMHIAMWSEYGLETAQSIKVKTPQDILFYIKLLAAKNENITQRIKITGNNISHETINLIKGYYQNVEIY